MGRGLNVGGLPPFGTLRARAGHLEIPAGAQAPDPSGEGVIEVNMGITVVVPAYDILGLMTDPALVSPREQLAARLAEHPSGNTPDG